MRWCGRCSTARCRSWLRSAASASVAPVVTSTFKPDCRLYVSAQNLLTLTGYSGFEPEVSGIGVDRGVYPQSTSFMVGTVINF